MSTQTESRKEPTRRAFLGWWLGTLMAAAVVSVVGPLGVYLFPPRDPKLMKETIRVALDTALANLKEGTVSRFDAPAGTAFLMADGGENNSPGDPTFGGFVTREGGQLRAFAITCPHLGCSYNFDDAKQHFLCPLPRLGIRARWTGASRPGDRTAVASDLAAGSGHQRDRDQRHRLVTATHI